MTRTRNLQNLPLAINVFGPMVFKKNGKLLEVWLPKLAKRYRHQAAIGTNVDSRDLGDLSEYSLTNPNPHCHPSPSMHHNPPPNKPCIPYEDTAVKYPPAPFYVHITLPRPKWIIGFSPVSCRIYEGAIPPAQFQYAPVGFRLFYDKAGSPVLTSSNDPKFRYDLNFDPASDEPQLEAFIAYSPYNFSDYGHHEAKNDFAKLTKMVGLKVNVDFEFPFLTGRQRLTTRTKGRQVSVLNGPAKDCKAPILLLK
jgi:hypothetical protein